MRCCFYRTILAFAGIMILSWIPVSGQNAGSIAVNRNALYNSYTPAQLVQNVLITGCLSASNVQWSGYFNATDPTRRQLGYFNKGTSNFPISDGLILSSGYVSDAEGPNNRTNRSDTDPPRPGIHGLGDVDLTTIAGVATHDAAILQFDFIPAGNTLEFQYVFSSEEYLEFVDAGYNDAFGFFLSRPGFNLGPFTNNATNIALIPLTLTPVTIDNVNDVTNAGYYINNPTGTLSTQYDGMTVVMTATYPVVPCTTYHIKLAVGDAHDYVYDSAVFLKARSFNSEPIGASNINTNVNLPDFSSIFEGCPGNQIVLQRDAANISQPATVQILYSGTATNGVDVKTTSGLPLPALVTIPAGQTTYTIDYYAVDDGIPDAGEVLNIQVLQSCPCDPNPVYITKKITIWEKNLAVSAMPSNVSCNSVNSGSITAITTNGSGENLFSIDGVTWQASNLFTGLSPGSYVIQAKNLGSCADPVSTTAVIGLANTIVANAGPDVSVCTGNSVELQGSGGSLYSWSPQNGLSDPNISNPIANPSLTTTYTLTVTDPTGLCHSSDDVIVTVNQSPVAGITPPGGDVCIGNTSIDLTASGGGTYLWNLVPSQTTPSITVEPASSTSYTVIVTGANGCMANATANVIVHPLPTAVISGTNTVCSGTQAELSVTLTGTAPWTIQYSDGVTTLTKFASTSPYNFLVSPPTTTTYTLVNVTDLWGCSGTDITGSATINILPLPTAPTSATVDHSGFCPGSYTDITLTASGGDYGTSINWYKGSCLSTVIGTGPSLTIPAPAATTTYYASNVNSCGVSACLPVSVTILTAPTAPNTITTGTNPYSYCTGTSLSLPYRLQANGAVNATGYEWYKDVGCGIGVPVQSGSSNILSLATAPSAPSTDYLVRSTNSDGCKSSNCALLTITVFPLSVGGSISSPDPTTVCSGGNTGTLNLNGQTGNVIRWEISATGGAPWTAITNTTTSLTYNNLTATTWYRAVVQSGSGTNICSPANSSTATITVNPLPVPSIAGSVTACFNTITNTYTTESGMSSYVWAVSAGGTITNGNGTNAITVTWNTLGAQTVSVNYVNANGCTAVTSSVKNITVNPLPVPTITGPTSACLNSTTNTYTTESGMSGYLWSVGAGGTITNGSGTNAITVTWNSPGSQTVSVNYTNANGCVAAIPTNYNVTINPLPIPLINGSATACIGSTTNTYTTDTGMSGYTWNISAGGTITAGSGTNTITVTWNAIGAQTISANYINANGCTAASPTLYNITVSALPVPTITGPSSVCINTDYTFTTEAGMSNYTWQVTGSGTITSGAGTNSITARWTGTGAKTVRVIYTNASGCTAAQFIYNVTAVTTPPTPTSITPSLAITYCASSPPLGTFRLTATPLVSGLTYEWYTGSCGGTLFSSSTNNFTTIPTPASTITYWVRTTNACGSSGCYSITITVYPSSVGGTIASDATVCNGNNSGILTLSGNIGNVIRWESSTNGGGTWNNIANTSSSQSYANLTQTTQYRAMVQSGTCASVYSGIATITTASVLNAGAHNTTALNECVGYNPAQLDINNPVTSGGILPYTFNWQINGVSVGAPSLPSYDPPAIAVAGVYNYNCVITDACNTIVSTSAKSITIVPDPTVTINGAGAVCQNLSATLTATISGGTGSYNYKWESGPTATGPWTTISAATLPTYSPLTSATGTIYYQVTISPAFGSCNNATSTSVAVIVNPLPTTSSIYHH